MLPKLKGSQPESNGSKAAVQAISQCLFEVEIQMHIVHLQAKDKSFAMHEALGAFYSSLADLNDDLVEKSFVKTGLMMNYTNMNITNNVEPISYIKKEMAKIESMRTKITEGYIQQIVDNILEQFAHAIYKLENLH
jgi:DNA-binding ferritin-like protein